MEPWGVEIKSGETSNVSIELGMLLDISQACLGNMKRGSEGIGSLEIVADGKPTAIERLCRKVKRGALEPWGLEIKSGEPFNVSIEQGKFLVISQACLGNMKRGSEGSGSLEIVADGKTIAIEGLCRKARIRPVGQQFDKDFIVVSHGFEDCSVFLYGEMLDTLFTSRPHVDSTKLMRAHGRWKDVIEAGTSADELAEAYAQWIDASTPPVFNYDDFNYDDYIPEAMDSDEKYEEEKCGALEPWGLEIKSGEPLNVSIEQGKFLDISQACLGNMKRGSEGIGSLEIVADGKITAIERLCRKAKRGALEPWGLEIKSGEPFNVSIEQGKFLVISQACLGNMKRGSEGRGSLEIVADGKSKTIAIEGLCRKARIRPVGQQFDKDFIVVSHGFEDCSVFLYGEMLDTLFTSRPRVDSTKLMRAHGRWKDVIEAGTSADELAEAYAQWIDASTPPVFNYDDFNYDDYIPEAMDSDEKYTCECDWHDRRVRTSMTAAELARLVGTQKKSGKKRPKSNTPNPNKKAKSK